MVTVTGSAATHRFIGGIPAKMQRVLKEAATAGATVFADDIKARTPSHDVREALQITTKTKDGGVTARVDLKTSWARSVGIWLEYGTSRHFISVDDSQKAGRTVGRINRLIKEQDGNVSLVIGGAFVGQTILHPGARPHPAFRPALDTKEQDAVAAAQDCINRSAARAIKAGDV